MPVRGCGKCPRGATSAVHRLISGLAPGWRKALTIIILEPFFISKPTEIWARFLDLACFTDRDGTWLPGVSGGFADCLERNQNNLWSATWATLRNTFWGFLVGVGSGVAVGLVLGRSEFLAKIFEPFIIAFNSLPRIGLLATLPGRSRKPFRSPSSSLA